MDGFAEYKLYLGIRQHFTSSSYDYFKYNGAVRATEDSFKKRADRYKFVLLGRKYTENLRLFYVCMYLHNLKSSIASLPSKPIKDLYSDTLARHYNLQSFFLAEMYSLFNKYSYNQLVDVSDNGMPYYVALYIADEITTESFIILSDILKTDFSAIQDEYIWPKKQYVANKYKPFLRYDLATYKKLFNERILNICVS